MNKDMEDSIRKYWEDEVGDAERIFKTDSACIQISELTRLKQVDIAIRVFDGLTLEHVNRCNEAWKPFDYKGEALSGQFVTRIISRTANDIIEIIGDITNE